MNVFVVNPGSSSVKLSVLGQGDRLLEAVEHELASGEDPAREFESFLARAPSVDIAGVRVVHGGPLFHDSVLIDDGVADRLEQLADLAPLHNPPALGAIAALRRLRPGLPVVACFDTAFHRTMPDHAATYPVPAHWGVRRYGFHGLSHSYSSRRAAQMLARPTAGLRLVTCHLGSGSSLAAVAGGVSVDTTMGYTPLEGVVMATRSGTVDPGAVLAVQRRVGLSVDQMEQALYHHSGLVALAGTSDMKEVLTRAGTGDRRAALAVGVYQHRLRAAVAAMAAAMGGVDAVVFTGGIGQRSDQVRRDAASGLAWLGLAIDAVVNEAGVGDRDISAPGALVRTLVVEAREDIEIARECRRFR